MIRFKAVPNDKPEDTSAAKPDKPVKAGKTSKTKAKTAKSDPEQDLLDLPSEVDDEKD